MLLVQIYGYVYKCCRKKIKTFIKIVFGNEN